MVATVFASVIVLTSMLGSVDTIKPNYVRLQSEDECSIMMDDLRGTKYSKQVVNTNTPQAYSVTYEIGNQTIQHTVRCIPLQRKEVPVVLPE